MRVLQQQAVLLVDLSNFVARATSVAQEQYLQLFGRMLLKQRRLHPHHRFVFAVEGAGTLRRQRILPRYKEGRIPSPGFNAARQQALRLLSSTQCTVIRAPDGEADDAIASFCQQNPTAEIVIVSDDRDLWQLICTNVMVLARIGKTATKVDRFGCKRHLGVDPAVVPLMKALCGDPSDNIPRGVPRVHKKKLLRLAQEAGGSVDQIPTVANTADWLTSADKKKIALAHSTVKHYLKVTHVWNLTLQQKQYAADLDALLDFLYQQGLNGKFTQAEIGTIVGV